MLRSVLVGHYLDICPRVLLLCLGANWFPILWATLILTQNITRKQNIFKKKDGDPTLVNCERCSLMLWSKKSGYVGQEKSTARRMKVTLIWWEKSSPPTQPDLSLFSHFTLTPGIFSHSSPPTWALYFLEKTPWNLVFTFLSLELKWCIFVSVVYLISSCWIFLQL